MALRSVPIRRSGVRNNLFLGGDRELVMLVPRLPAGLCAGRPGPPLGAEVWHDTHIELGGPAKGYRDLLSGLTVGADGALAVGAVLTHFPVAALCAD